MLQNIRDNSQGWIAKTIIGIIVALMALTGFDAIMTSTSTAQTAAEVNGEEISQSALAQAADAQRRQLMQQLGTISKQTSAMLEQTTALMRNANGLLNDQGKQMFGSAEGAMRSLEQSTATINTLLSDNKESLNSGMQGLNELAPAVRELRDTLGALRSFSRRLEQDPTGYLLRNDSIKEFQP